MSKTSAQKYAEIFADDAVAREFQLEALILRITNTLFSTMESKGLSRSDLARLLDVSRPAVTKLLNGTSNFKLKTLVNVSHVLDCDLTVDLVPRDYDVQIEYTSYGRMDQVSGSIDEGLAALMENWIQSYQAVASHSSATRAFDAHRPSDDITDQIKVDDVVELAA